MSALAPLMREERTFFDASTHSEHSQGLSGPARTWIHSGNGPPSLRLTPLRPPRASQTAATSRAVSHLPGNQKLTGGGAVGPRVRSAPKAPKVVKVSDLHHRVAPVGGAASAAEPARADPHAVAMRRTPATSRPSPKRSAAAGRCGGALPVICESMCGAPHVMLFPNAHHVAEEGQWCLDAAQAAFCGMAPARALLAAASLTTPRSAGCAFSPRRWARWQREAIPAAAGTPWAAPALVFTVAGVRPNAVDGVGADPRAPQADELCKARATA
jgi:hypothetical protein